MRDKAPTESSSGDRITLVAWLVTFVVPLALIGLLLAFDAAHAATPTAPRNPTALLDEELEAEEEAEGEEEREDGCEEEEEEEEEEDEFVAEPEPACDTTVKGKGNAGAGAAVVLPEECLLRTFHARAVAYPSHRQLKLTIGYTTHEPTSATVDFGLKGSLHLGTAKRHLGAQGVLRFSKHLSGPQSAKLGRAHRLTVQIDISSTPLRCDRYYSALTKVKRR